MNNKSLVFLMNPHLTLIPATLLQVSTWEPLTTGHDIPPLRGLSSRWSYSVPHPLKNLIIQAHDKMLTIMSVLVIMRADPC